MEWEVEVSVLPDGHEEGEVEHDDQGGEGGVAWDPDPLQVPGQLLPNVDIHLEILWVCLLPQPRSLL